MTLIFDKILTNTRLRPKPPRQPIMRKVVDGSKTDEVGATRTGILEVGLYLMIVLPNVSGLKAVESAFPNSEMLKKTGV